MGWTMSWVAVRGMSAGELWRRLGLRPTRRTAKRPEWNYSATSADSGWVVVCANRDDRFVDGAVLGPLSALGEVVGCFVEEHALSQAVCWKNGVRQWTVAHDADRSLDHLQATGDLPESFQAVEAAALEGRRRDPQGPDLLFDVPVNLARAIVGFRHDDAAGRRIFGELTPERAKAPARASARSGLLGSFTRWLRGA